MYIAILALFILRYLRYFRYLHKINLYYNAYNESCYKFSFYSGDSFAEKDRFRSKGNYGLNRYIIKIKQSSYDINNE